MTFLIGVIIFILFIIFAYLFIQFKLKRLAKHYFGTTDLKKALEISEIRNEETPKSLGSMDSLYLSNLRKDFPDINLNELKRLTESFILEIFDSIENKDITRLSNKNEKIIAFVNAKIEDLKDKKVEFSNLKIHNTVLNKYENSNGIANIYLATSFEYYKRVENGEKRKIQNRIKSEFIYIIDPNSVKESIRSLGLNCPNCGAPIKTIHHKSCVYCKSGIVDLVKKSFVLNDIKEY